MRWAPAMAAVLCLATATVAVIGIRTGWGRSTTRMAIGLVAFDLIIAGISLIPAGRRRLERLAPKLVLAGLATVVALLVAEVVVRQVSPPSIFHPRLAFRPYQRMELRVELPGVSPQGLLTTNRWGLRGRDPPAGAGGALKLLAVGGSTTHCFYLDDQKTWPALIEQRLQERFPGVWVGNAGQDGHSTRGHLLVMEHVTPRVRPHVVLLLVGLNDMLLPLTALGPRAGSDFDDFDALATSDPIRRIEVRLLHASRLAQAAYVWKQILVGRATIVDLAGHGGFVPQSLDEPPPKLPADIAQVLPQLPEFERNVRRIIDLARAGGATPVFLTQPIRFGETDEYRLIAGRHYWVGDQQMPTSAADQRRMLDVYNDRLLAVCADENAECFDLATNIPPGEECFYDSAHFNEHGAARVAEAVANFLLGSGILDQAPEP